MVDRKFTKKGKEIRRVTIRVTDIVYVILSQMFVGATYPTEVGSFIYRAYGNSKGRAADSNQENRI